MPLLDIAIAQSSFHNYPGYSRAQLFVHGQIPNCCLLQHESRRLSLRKSFQNTRNLSLNLGRINKKSYHQFFVKAVATLEPKCSVQSKDEKKKTEVLPSSIELLSSALDSTVNEDSEEIDERERLRRIRISKANKGNTPWNKGRKHSPETLRRIRERTRLAMQDPKVKMKLANLGHAQSQETREKIAVGVRLGWQRRRAKLQIQETCLYDWQNLIAEAARKGFQHDEELQWDSYKIINEQLQQEWLASIEQRKATPRPRGNKRAPKSPEQRRKIAEAIAAKWADPEYRSRVSTGLAKYYGTPEGAEKKAKRKPRHGSQSPRTPKKKVSDAEMSDATGTMVRNQQTKLKRRIPKYKDPLANSKLEMLKNIRAQRVASEERKNEALERAKLLIVEAEKATKALEVAATRSPVARASLIEARKLIAEATQSIESIDNDEPSQGDLTFGQQYRVKDENSITDDDANQEHHIGVNGTNIGFIQTTEGQNPVNGVYKMPTIKEVDANMKVQLESQLGGFEYSKFDIGSFIGKSELRDVIDQQRSPELNGGAIQLNGLSSHHTVTKMQNHEEQVPPAPAKPVTKKWVRGRLVEVLEDE